MSVATDIEEKLRAKFSPVHLRVEDDSARHAGHAGARAGGDSHFNVEMVAVCFEGVTRVQRSRQVHDVLAQELLGPVHALSLKLDAPSERGSG